MGIKLYWICHFYCSKIEVLLSTHCQLSVYYPLCYVSIICSIKSSIQQRTHMQPAWDAQSYFTLGVFNPSSITWGWLWNSRDCHHQRFIILWGGISEEMIPVRSWYISFICVYMIHLASIKPWTISVNPLNIHTTMSCHPMNTLIANSGARFAYLYQMYLTIYVYTNDNQNDKPWCWHDFWQLYSHIFEFLVNFKVIVAF